LIPPTQYNTEFPNSHYTTWPREQRVEFELLGSLSASTTMHF